MVSRWRFELQTPWLKVKCSTDWASETILKKVVASAGFEPAECKSQSLVPYHLATRQLKQVVESRGFEPRNPKEQIYSLPRLATSLTLQNNGAENRNRTRNLLITSQLLYQLSYFGTYKKNMVGDERLELPTPCL